MSIDKLGWDAESPLASPFFGARLRIVWQHVREQMLVAIHQAGYIDFQEAHFAIFSFPLPNGTKPSEIARQKKISRQAVNYLLSQLERLGYLERRTPGGSDRRLVYLSEDGHKIADAIFDCLRRLEEEFTGEIGVERFLVFLDVLGELSDKRLGERLDRATDHDLLGK